MKLEVLQESLKRGLSVVSRAVATRSTLPVLSNVLLSTDEGRLKLSATNLEIGITTFIGTKVEIEGSVTLPAKLLSDFVAGLLNDTPISMNLDDKTQIVALKCGKFKATIHGISADEYPVTLPANNTSNIITLPADVMRAVADRVAIVADDGITRPTLGGVCMAIGIDGAVAFIAADGSRLATMNGNEHGGVVLREATQYIIPARAIIELARIVDGDSVRVALSENGVIFQCETIELNTRLIDGQYPDVSRIIPERYTTRAILNTAELRQAVKIASLFTDQVTNFLRLALQNGGSDTLTITTRVAETGDNESVVACAVLGESVVIGIDARYLADGLACIKTKEVALELQTATHPLIIKPVGEDGYLHQIMPMTIR